MPIYEYRCPNCDKVFEKIQRGFDEHDEPCPACGGQAKRIMSNTSFVLKGTGWYVTDYCHRNGGAESPANGKGGKEGDSGQAATSDGPAAKSEAPAATGSSETSAKPAPSCASGGCAGSCAASK